MGGMWTLAVLKGRNALIRWKPFNGGATLLRRVSITIKNLAAFRPNCRHADNGQLSKRRYSFWASP